MFGQKLFRVLMVYPLFPPSFWSFLESMRLMKLKATMPPTGLATVAAMLPTDWFEVLPIVDMNVEPLTDNAIRSADVVMISAMIAQEPSLRKAIARVKSFGKTVVVGGPYATSYPNETIAMGADHLVLNEAEMTLPAFVEDFIAGKARKIYDEHSVVRPINVFLTKEGKPRLTTTPIPRWDLLKLSLYSSIAIQYSRGCPFGCEFCDITNLFGHESRTKTVGQMIAELEAIFATGWRGTIFIVDDNFIGNRTNLREFLPILILWQKKHGYPFAFFTEASVDLANPNMRDILKMMVEAGFQDVFCGIESTNTDVLTAMNKGQNIGDLNEKVSTLQEAGFEVTAGFIIGSDADKPTVFDDLFKFIQNNGIVIPMPGLLAALRGTVLHRRLASEGRLREKEFSGNNTHRFEFNFKPVLSEEFLVEGYVDLLEQLFSPANYYERCRTLRQRRGRKLLKKSPVHGSWLHATFIVFYRNLIRRPSWEFAKFMFGTFLTSPGDIQTAVTQAVKFEHFKKITQAAVSAHRYSTQVETLLERFTNRVKKLQGDIGKRLQKLTALERRFLSKALRYYRALDPSFRADAKKALASLRDKLRECTEMYRKEWQGLAT